MTVNELLSRVSSKELEQWKLYFHEEPFGYDMENWRTALLAMLISAPHRKKGAQKPKLKDFMPKLRPIEDPDNDSGISGDPLD